MTREELIAVTIDQYGDLQRIKKANGGHKNNELDYLLKLTAAKLSSLGVNVEDIPLTKRQNGHGDIMDMKAREMKLWLQRLQEKLAEAEDDLCQGRTVEARTALEALKEKYDL